MISVPLLPHHADSSSESLRLELSPAALDVQDLLLRAAAQNASVQLGKQHKAVTALSVRTSS